MIHKGDAASDGSYTPGCEACWWTLVWNLKDEDHQWYLDIITSLEMWMRNGM